MNSIDKLVEKYLGNTDLAKLVRGGLHSDKTDIRESALNLLADHVLQGKDNNQKRKDVFDNGIKFNLNISAMTLQFCHLGIKTHCPSPEGFKYLYWCEMPYTKYFIEGNHETMTPTIKEIRELTGFTLAEARAIANLIGEHRIMIHGMIETGKTN